MLNSWGMWVCGAGVALIPLGNGSVWWGTSAAIAGLGMAMLYPNLSTAVADIAHPNWRASAIGIYRFWRDLGYGIGALGLGAAAAWSGRLEGAFWCVAVAMLTSGAVLFTGGRRRTPGSIQPPEAQTFRRPGGLRAWRSRRLRALAASG